MEGTKTMLTIETLSSKSGPELCAIYNAIPSTEPVKRFASRADAVKRIMRSLADSPEAVPAAPVVVEPTPDSTITLNGEVVAVVTKGRPRKTEFAYDYPVRLPLRSYRANSGRGRLIDILREGVTFEQALERCPQWTASQLNKTIRMLHTWLGYGVQTQDDSVIRLIQE